jgi:hypothetical protein
MSYVHEITTVTPDMICIEYRDADMVKGEIIHLDEPDAGDYGVYYDRVHPTRGTLKAQVFGRDKDYLWFADLKPSSYLNRAAVDDVGNWSAIGGCNVVSVHRWSTPCNDGMSDDAPNFFSQYRHRVYLKLDDDLPQGAHTIVHPEGLGLANTAFTFNDKVTRCRALKVTHAGMRASDVHKRAFLSEWVRGYGNDGAVEYATAYGIEEAFIIDEDGDEVAGPFDVVLKINPTDHEPLHGTWWNKSWANDIEDPTEEVKYYISLTGPSTPIQGVSIANPAVVTAEGHGLSNGDLVTIDDVDINENGTRGVAALMAGMYRVQNATTDTFTMKKITDNSVVSSVGMTAVQGGDDNGGVVRPLVRLNRAGTYNYKIDFESWEPETDGDYRVYIPGLGVSDPFPVRESVYHKVAKTCWQGLYNNRNGCALSREVGGIEQPVSFKSGEGGLTIYGSTLPGWLGNETGRGGPVNASLGSKPPWDTDDELDWWGGHKDAADWDSILNSHAHIYWLLLDICERVVGARTTNFGTPKSSAMLGATYTGTDDLPDLVHEAIWGLDTWRRTQHEDGWVYGGIQMGSRDPEIVDVPPGGAPYVFITSWTWRLDAHAMGPDHGQTVQYAACAAKLSKVLRIFGHTTLADMWLASAEAAWDWADNLWTDWSERNAFYSYIADNLSWVETTISNAANNGSGKVRLTVADTTGFSAGVYGIEGVSGTTEANGFQDVTVIDGTHLDLPNVNFSNAYVSGGGVGVLSGWIRDIHSDSFGGAARIAASASLLSAVTGDAVKVAKYKAAFEAAPPYVDCAALQGCGQWEYINDVNKDNTIANQIRDIILANADGYFVAQYEAVSAYDWIPRGDARQHNDSQAAQVLMWAHQTSTDPEDQEKYLKCIQAHLAHVLGANPHGRSMLTGLGYRNFTTGLHGDHQIAGGTAGIPGKPHLTYSDQGGGVKATFNFDQAIFGNPYPGDFDQVKRSQSEPFDAIPLYEATLESAWAIDCCEFTIGGQTMPWLIMATYAHAHDGNDEVEAPVRRMGVRLGSVYKGSVP